MYRYRYCTIFLFEKLQAYAMYTVCPHNQANGQSMARFDVPVSEDMSDGDYQNVQTTRSKPSSRNSCNCGVLLSPP